MTDQAGGLALTVAVVFGLLGAPAVAAQARWPQRGATLLRPGSQTRPAASY